MGKKKSKEMEAKDLESGDQLSLGQDSTGQKDDFVPETQPVVVLPKEERIDSAGIRKRVIELRDHIGNNYTEICRYLYTIQHKGLYESWGYRSFREYASKELQYKATKAMYLASIWKNLHENQDKNVFEKVIQLGWSKAKELSRVATKENVDSWVDKAKHLGVDALVKEVRQEISAKIPNDPKSALEQESEVEGTPVQNEKKMISLTFEYDDYMTLMRASDRIQTEMPGTPISRVIAHVCADFLGSDSGESGFDFALSQMKRLAAVHEKNLIIIDKKKGDIDFGYEHLEELLKSVHREKVDAEASSDDSSRSVTEEELEDISGAFNNG